MAEEQPPRALSVNKDDPSYDPAWVTRLAVFLDGAKVERCVAYDMGDLAGGGGWAERLKVDAGGKPVLDARRNWITERATGVVTVEIVVPIIQDN